MIEKYLIEWCSSTLASLKTASLFNWFYTWDGLTREDVYKNVKDMNTIFEEKGISIEILRENEKSWVDIIDLQGRINSNYHSKNRRINQCL